LFREGVRKMSPNKEAGRSAQIEALADTFKKWGWDESIPRVISGWGDFACTDTSFELKIDRGITTPRRETRIGLSLLSEAGLNEPVKTLSFYYCEQNGKKLEISGSPVAGVVLLNKGEGLGIGRTDQQRLLISLLSRFGGDEFRVAFSQTGEICRISRGFGEEYDELMEIRRGDPVILGY